MIDQNVLNIQVQSLIQQHVDHAVKQALAHIDISRVVQESVNKYLEIQISQMNFPESSIPASSIKFDSKISGDIVSGGVIEDFSSQGIEDFATNCILSLDDNEIKSSVTFRAPSVQTQSLVVAGTATFSGSMVAESGFFDQIVSSVFDNIRPSLLNMVETHTQDVIQKNSSISGDQIVLNGEQLILNGQLHNSVTKSNIQQLGYLQELKVKGESLLSNTLLVTNKRVGVNTTQPDHVLDIWDQECQLIWHKDKSNHSYLGTARAGQTMTLGVNNKENIKLQDDGSVKFNKVVIGNVVFESSSQIPTDIRDSGVVVINENPANGIFAWISLGGGRWQASKLIFD